MKVVTLYMVEQNFLSDNLLALSYHDKIRMILLSITERKLILLQMIKEYKKQIKILNMEIGIANSNKVLVTFYDKVVKFFINVLKFS